MQYADKMEASKMTLSELLSTTTISLSSQFGMKRGHVSRFINRENSCGIPMVSSYFRPASEKNTNDQTCDGSENDSNKGSLHRLQSHLKLNPNYDPSTAKAVLDLKLNEGHVFKGIVASKPVEPRLFGCMQPPHIVEDVASHSTLGNIAVQKLTPEYKVGVQRLLETKAPPMKASDLWSEKATILLCIRRPGAEAHQLYSRKAIFDALGFKLVAVLHEKIESEVISATLIYGF
ncbi:uncharacterized protein LOC110024362 [Phalaenopsis equestris]|uniref:uncharacterized protein LOC110024362 n=1 Tax=Phalaenopsis equestris TaxID=78828 RepID=UPI0009E39B42|nr:uncharacterized protein LOC110024362 [Phalaenopsis equestris]